MFRWTNPKAGLIALGVCLMTTPAYSQQSALVETPCPAPLATPPALSALRERLLDPATVELKAAEAFSDPQAQAYLAETAARAKLDWANLCRYRADNATLLRSGRQTRAVFFGNSISEYWLDARPEDFRANNDVGRGISGQTSQHNLLRFRQDVIELRPAVVHLLTGANDIAGNSGPTTAENLQGNIASMVELAQAHGIKVVLGSITPAAQFGWRPELRPAASIQAMNLWLRDYARAKGAIYADYHGVLADEAGGLKRAYSADGVHPNREGYRVMQPLAERAIKEALSR
jgi:lysophospholipase L1-like esterase